MTLAEAEQFHADRQTDRHDEAYRRSSEILRSRLKMRLIRSVSNRMEEREAWLGEKQNNWWDCGRRFGVSKNAEGIFVPVNASKAYGRKRGVEL